MIFNYLLNKKLKKIKDLMGDILIYMDVNDTDNITFKTDLWLGYIKTKNKNEDKIKYNIYLYWDNISNELLNEYGLVKEGGSDFVGSRRGVFSIKKIESCDVKKRI